MQLSMNSGLLWFMRLGGLSSFFFISLQRKSEAHLFKWEDELFLDEICLLDAQQRRLAVTVQ